MLGLGALGQLPLGGTPRGLTATVPDSGTVLMPGKSGPFGSHFSRKRFDELMAAQRAQDEAERRAAELKNSKQKAELLKAAAVAQRAIDTIRASEDAEAAHEFAQLVQMTAALEAATGASKVVAIIADARAAQDHAMAILSEMEEEDEAVMLLLH